METLQTLQERRDRILLHIDHLHRSSHYDKRHAVKQAELKLKELDRLIAERSKNV